MKYSYAAALLLANASASQAYDVLVTFDG